MNKIHIQVFKTPFTDVYYQRLNNVWCHTKYVMLFEYLQN